MSKKAKAYNISTLAEAYGITRHTLKVWIKPLKINILETGRVFTPRDLKRIINLVGEIETEE
jgi:transposase-like protein